MSVFEVAHWSGILPLLTACVVAATLRHRGEAIMPGLYWWVAAGLAVSVFADSIQKLGGGGFDVTFYYTPLQVGIVLAGFREGVLDRVMVLALLVVCGWVSAHVTTAPAEWLVALVGGIAICLVAFERERLRAVLWTYFGLGTLAYVWLIPTIRPPGSEMDPRFMGRWLLYQSCRWLAFALFILTTAPRRRVHA